MSLVFTEFFSLMGFLGWLWHTVIPSQSIWPWCVLFRCFRGMSKGVKMGIFEHFRLFWQPKNILKKKMQGKMLWFVITVCQRHPRNPIRKRNLGKTNLKCPIFEFLKISYTFSVNFYSKIRATRGGVKWPSIMPKFFFWAFHDICT